MNKRKVFCEECRKDVEYSVTNKQLKGTIKGETYTYIGKVAHCISCNSNLYVANINDFNLTALYDRYNEHLQNKEKGS